MAGKGKDQNPRRNKVSKRNPALCLQAFAPNSGNFRDPRANTRGRKPADWPFRADSKRWISQTARILLRDLDAVLNEAGEQGWDYQILVYRDGSESPDASGEDGEVVVVFKKSYVRRELNP